MAGGVANGSVATRTSSPATVLCCVNEVAGDEAMVIAASQQRQRSRIGVRLANDGRQWADYQQERSEDIEPVAHEGAASSYVSPRRALLGRRKPKPLATKGPRSWWGPKELRGSLVIGASARRVVMTAPGNQHGEGARSGHRDDVARCSSK